MTRPFVFSADAHIAEPPDLYLDGLPKHLQHWAFNVEVEGKNFILKIGDKVRLQFIDGAGAKVELEIGAGKPRGARTTFGLLPPQYVWIESRKLEGNVG